MITVNSKCGTCMGGMSISLADQAGGWILLGGNAGGLGLTTVPLDSTVDRSLPIPSPFDRRLEVDGDENLSSPAVAWELSRAAGVRLLRRSGKGGGVLEGRSREAR